ncbi:dehydratase, partial [Propionibacterium freudenreichii]|nr:dehydratase [Propionibacterium freudenreichii]
MSAFDPAAVRAGDVLPPLTLTITRGGIVRYAGASTDFNPIHWSDRKARELGLPGVLAHGMWTMGASLRIITDWCADPRRVLDYQVRFTRPVQVPDDDRGVQVQVSASVTGVE